MKKNTLRKNLYFIFLVSIICPIFLISGVFLFFYSQQVQKQENQHIHNILVAESSNIYSFLNEMEKVSSAPYLYNDIYSLMVRMRNGTVSSASQSEIELYSLTYLKLIYNCPDTVENIAFYPVSKKDDTIFLLSRSCGDLQSLSTDGYFTEQWFSDAQEADGNIQISGIHSSSYPDQRVSDNVITLSRAIKDFDTQKSIGVLKVDVSAKIMTDILDQIQTSEHSHAVLLDQSASPIYKTGSVSAGLLSQLKTENTVLQDQSGFYSVEGTDIPEYGWRLVYLSSEADLMSSASKLLFFAAAVTLLVILLAFAVYSRQSRKIVVAVDKIVSTIRKFGNGDLSAKAGVKNQNELSLISNALDQMGAQLNEHIDKEYKATISQKNAEYRALQSQINPHFFYNTLNGFLSLNRMGEQDLLETSIIEMTQLFRYTCSGQEITAVKEEFEFLKRYLELQKLRFEERLNFSISLEEPAAKEAIPRLLLQPIVENSIVHGMEPREQPIHIAVEGHLIRTGENKTVLELVVRDDGIGFDTEQMGKDPSKVGIKNIEERLHYFESSAQFSVQSRPDHGTVCTIRIPAGEQRSTPAEGSRSDGGISC